MTKSKSPGSSLVAPSNFVIHSVNGAQFLNATWVAWYPIIVTLLLTKM